MSNVPNIVDSHSLVYVQVSVLKNRKLQTWVNLIQEVEVINGDGFSLTERLIETMVDAFGFSEKTVKFSYGDDCVIYRDGSIERVYE